MSDTTEKQREMEFASDVIDLFLEYRDRHGHTEITAKAKTVMECGTARDAEIERLNKWTLADSKASRGEGHSFWCEGQLADGACNCPMRLHAEIERLKYENKKLFDDGQDRELYVDKLGAEIERLRHILRVHRERLLSRVTELTAERDHWQNCFGELWLEWDDTDD
jgi:FtsZ-binding cell division protein ZapB